MTDESEDKNTNGKTAAGNGDNTDKTDDANDNSATNTATAAVKVASQREPSVIQSAPRTAAPRTESSVSKLAIAAVALSVVAVAGAAYLWLSDAQQRQQLDTSQATIIAAGQQLQQTQQQVRALQRELDRQSAEADRKLLALNGDIESLQGKLASQQKRLLSLSTTDRDDWLLAEAEYLMRLANQRLLMGKEIAGAHDLLKAADSIMVELDDSGLYPVRTALAEDMASLRAAGRFDLEGLYLALRAAANQGDQLQLFAMPQLQTGTSEATQPENWQQRLQSGLAAAWQKLSQYIQIKRRDEVYKPLLAPEYESAVRQNLRLMFEQAQMAALAGNQTLYEDSLKKAHYYLTHFYTLDKTSAQALIATVDTLVAEQVEVKLPDISGSLRALKHYMETLHGVTPITPPASQSVNSAAPVVTGNTTETLPSGSAPDTESDGNASDSAPTAESAQ